MHYRDNGKGIDKEQRDAIFMPFYTTRRTSARNKGLGLYQTYNLLTELMHGHIEWPEHEDGFALVVRFALPTQEKAVAAAPAQTDINDLPQPAEKENGHSA